MFEPVGKHASGVPALTLRVSLTEHAGGVRTVPCPAASPQLRYLFLRSAKFSTMRSAL